MNKRTILLAGSYGYGNVGDDAIALAAGRLLKEADPGAEVIALGGDPSLLRRSSRLPARHLSFRSPLRLAQMVALVRRSDAVLIGGGGLLQDTLPHFYRPYLLSALMAKALGKRVMFYAVGAYPPRTRLFREMLHLALDRADVITVRDEFSAKAIGQAGVRREVRLAADPVITLQQPLCQALARDERTPRIGVSLRPWYHLEGMGGDTEEFVSDLALCLDAVIEATGGRLMFLPLQSGGVDDDSRTQQRVAARMKHGRDVSAFVSNDPLTVLGGIDSCDLVLGMRLHANVLAAAAGVPSLAIAYDPKVAGFMEWLGCADQVVLLRELRPPQLAEKALGLLRNRGQAVSRLREGRERLVESAREVAAIAVRLAGAPPVMAWGRHAVIDNELLERAA